MLRHVYSYDIPLYTMFKIITFNNFAVLSGGSVHKLKNIIMYIHHLVRTFMCFIFCEWVGHLLQTSLKVGSCLF